MKQLLTNIAVAVILSLSIGFLGIIVSFIKEKSKQIKGNKKL